MRALLLSLVAIALLGADAPPPAGTLTLDELLRHMASTRGVLTEFREVKVLALLDAPLETKGAFYYLPPDRLARITRTPTATRLLLVNGHMRFEDDAGVNEIDLSQNPVARQFAENLIVLWRGDRVALEEIYRLEFHADGPRWQLGLAPKGAPLDRFIASIRLKGDGPTLHEMELVETDGDKTLTVFDKTDADHVFTPDEERAIFGPKAAP